jgi:hypothetical protein
MPAHILSTKSARRLSEKARRRNWPELTGEDLALRQLGTAFAIAHTLYTIDGPDLIPSQDFIAYKAGVSREQVNRTINGPKLERVIRDKRQRMNRRTGRYSTCRYALAPLGLTLPRLHRKFARLVERTPAELAESERYRAARQQRLEERRQRQAIARAQRAFAGSELSPAERAIARAGVLKTCDRPCDVSVTTASLFRGGTPSEKGTGPPSPVDT